MHVNAGSPEIVCVGKPSILNLSIFHNNGLAPTHSLLPSMAEHRPLPGDPKDQLKSSKSTTLSNEDGKRLVDSLKYRLKPRKSSSDSESVNGSESESYSVASDAGSAVSSDSQSGESSDEIEDGGEEDLEVRVNIGYLNCCEHQEI